MPTPRSSTLTNPTLSVFLLLIAFLFLPSCNLINGEEEEDYSYYEPIIGEEFVVTVDLSKKIEYEYKKQEDLIVETEDDRGYKYRLEIPAGATSPGSYGIFEGYIAPVTGIENLPSDVEFLFGLEIEPYGESFVKPVTVSVEIQGNIDTENLRGFFNEGQGGWAYLAPVIVEKSSNLTKAVFNVHHFSSYGGISADDSYFDCPDVRSAQTCDDLREVIACNLGHIEVGINEEMNAEDRNLVNSLLKTWMSEQLQYASTDEIDFSDVYEFQYELSQYLCWKSMTQEYNSNPEFVFANLFDEAETLILEGFMEVMGELDVECVKNLELVPQDCSRLGTVVFYTQAYLEWLAIAQELGIENDPAIIDMFDFCGNSVENTYIDFAMIHAETMAEFVITSGSEEGIADYHIILNGPDHTIPVAYIMTDLLGELVEIDESEMQWIDQGDWGTTVANAITCKDGIISLNKSNATVYGMLYSNMEDRPTRVHTDYELFRGNCLEATVTFTWSRL